MQKYIKYIKACGQLLPVLVLLTVTSALFAEGAADWNVGVSVGGFRDNSPAPGAMQKIKEAGFDRIEISLSDEGAAWTDDQQKANLAAFKADCDAAGLAVNSIHVPFSGKLDISSTNEENRQQTIALVKKLMEWNKEIGAPIFVIHPSAEPIKDEDRPARKVNCIKSLKELTDAAKNANIRLAVEDLPRTCLMRNAEEVNEILGAVQNGVGMVFDSNHLLQETPEEFLSKLDPSVEIITTHISDYDGLDEKHWAPYEGVVHWKAVMEELVKRGFGGPFVFEGAGLAKGGGLSYADLFKRWKMVRDEYLTGFPPTCRIWPSMEILNSKPVVESAGEKKGLVEPIFYTGPIYQGKPTKVFAYLGRPEGEGPFPAILLIHGGGGFAFSDWADYWAKRGYVALAMDLNGWGADQKDTGFGGPVALDPLKFKDFDADTLRDIWPWQAIAEILYGHSVLKNMPEVDSKKIAATGISWGGYLTSMLSGVDYEIRCFVPVYGCGYIYENSMWIESDFNPMTPEHKARWSKYFDPSVTLPYSTAPMFWVTGMKDRAYPMDSCQKSFHLPSGERTLSIWIDRPHGHIWTFTEVDAYIDAQLEVGNWKPMIKMSEPAVENNTVSVQILGENKPSKAEIYWTEDSGVWLDRAWQTAPAAMDGDVVSAPVPEKAVCFYLVMTDERGFLVTSTPVER